MASAEPVQKAKDWRRKERLPVVLLQLLVVGVLMAVGVVLYVRHGVAQKALHDKVQEARLAARGDNPAELRAALAILDEGLALDAKDAETLALAASLHTQLWLVHRDPGSEAPAKALLARAIDEGSQAPERYASEALQTLATGDAKAADTFVEGLLEQGANNAQLFYAAGRVRQAQGALRRSREAFQRAMERAWREPRFSHAYAEQALEDGQFGPAADALDKALASNAAHLQSLLLAGLVGAYQGHPAAGSASAAQAILARKDGELTPALRARALALEAELALLEGDGARALELADRGLGLDAGSVHAAFARARALLRLKDPGAAQGFLAAASLRPTAPWFYFAGAEALLAAGEAPGAGALLEAYARAFGSVRVESLEGGEEGALERDDRYWLARGRLLIATRDPGGALQAFDRAVAAKGLHQDQALLAKGALLMEQEEFDRAREVLAPVAPEDGTGLLPDAYRAMGELLFRAKDFRRGAAHYGFALGRMGADGAPRERLEALRQEVASALKTGGQPALSKAWLEESKALVP